MLLVTDIHISPLQLPFSLYASSWSLRCKGGLFVLTAVFTASTMSTASFHYFAGVSVIRQKRILLSPSVGFLKDPEFSAAVVLSYTVSRLTVVVRIPLLTGCHVCVSVFDSSAATTTPMVMGGM